MLILEVFGICEFLPYKPQSAGQRTCTAESFAQCVIWYHLACQSESSFKNFRLSVSENWQVNAVYLKPKLERGCLS